MKFDIHTKEREGLLYENGAVKKIVDHSKLKLWTSFWGLGEHEWPLGWYYNFMLEWELVPWVHSTYNLYHMRL